MSKKALKSAIKQFKKVIIDSHSQCGDETIIVQRDALRDLMTFLRDDPALCFEMLSDVTAVDWLGVRPSSERFEVVYHLLSLTHKHRMRVKVNVPEDDTIVETLCDLYASAEWAEREVYDMYGISFRNHPDPRRILLYEEFEGHPLRKDYPILGSQPRIDLIDVERPNTNLYRPNFGEYGPEKENR